MGVRKKLVRKKEKNSDEGETFCYVNVDEQWEYLWRILNYGMINMMERLS